MAHFYIQYIKQQLVNDTAIINSFINLFMVIKLDFMEKIGYRYLLYFVIWKESDRKGGVRVSRGWAHLSESWEHGPEAVINIAGLIDYH